MGRRRRKREIRIVKPKIPKFFSCPNCGAESVSVNIDKPSRKVTVSCGVCGVIWRTEAKEYEEPVDVYSRFVDAFLNGEILLPEG